VERPCWALLITNLTKGAIYAARSAAFALPAKIANNTDAEKKKKKKKNRETYEANQTKL